MNQGKLIALVLVLLVVLGGSYLYARYDMSERFSTLASRVHDDVATTRGLEGTPSEADIAAHVQQIASELDLELADLTVSVETVEGEALDQADPIARRVRTGIETATKWTQKEGEDAPTRESLRMRATTVEVRARVHAEKWAWSLDEGLEVNKVIGRHAR